MLTANSSSALTRRELIYRSAQGQIMAGDVIRHLRECREHLGHVHVAGVPGRNEIDDTQEVNYPTVL